MRRLMTLIIILPLGCAGCALVTLPFKAVDKTVDWATTSSDEADRNLGRRIRRDDERRRRDEASIGALPPTGWCDRRSGPLELSCAPHGDATLFNADLFLAPEANRDRLK